jgi:hypothetical protein
VLAPFRAAKKERFAKKEFYSKNYKKELFATQLPINLLIAMH